jgi:hypothetical protein
MSSFLWCNVNKLKRGETLNISQNGTVLANAFICFFFFFFFLNFSLEGILVACNLQNDVVLIFFIHFHSNN